MRKLLFIAVLLCGGLGALAQEAHETQEAQGTRWREFNTFREVLAAATREDRPVFVDCYTSWCAPCRFMTERVFPQPEIGEFLNNGFVCVKIDMEKGEGPALAERYGVRIFPTCLVIDPDGTMRHKTIGAIEGTGFINVISAAFDPDKALGPRLERFDAGERDPAFLKSLHDYLTRIYDERAEEVAREMKSTL